MFDIYKLEGSIKGALSEEGYEPTFFSYNSVDDGTYDVRFTVYPVDDTEQTVAQIFEKLGIDVKSRRNSSVDDMKLFLLLSTIS